MRNALLFYCRAGFENDVRHEWEARTGQTGGWESAPGYVLFKPGKAGDHENPNVPRANETIFARQTIRVMADIELGEKDRLGPILEALQASGAGPFNDVWLEHPDSDEGKPLSGFCRRFGDVLGTALTEMNLLNERAPYRLHVFFPSMTRAIIGTTDPRHSNPWPMGIARVRMPTEAPSRSTLKLSEAFMTLVPDADSLLKPGMTGVDLGAAPGGWTYQLVARGLKVFAIDNGPMKGDMAIHPHVKHLREDGFRYKPQHPVDWLVCDMIEQPARIAELISKWLANGMARHAVFNLKLPMKKRWAEIEKCFGIIEAAMDRADVHYVLTARHLYHDREEITCYLGRPKAPVSARKTTEPNTGAKARPATKAANAKPVAAKPAAAKPAAKPRVGGRSVARNTSKTGARTPRNKPR